MTDMKPYITIMKKICDKYEEPELATLEFLIMEEEAIHIQEGIMKQTKPYSMKETYFYLALGRITDVYKTAYERREQ